MSIAQAFGKYPRLLSVVISFAITLVVVTLWLTVGASVAYGQEVSGITVESPATNWGVPTVGTAATGGMVIYWLINFLNKTIERYEARLTECENNWSAKYHDLVKESLQDARLNHRSNVHIP